MNRIFQPTTYLIFLLGLATACADSQQGQSNNAPRHTEVFKLDYVKPGAPISLSYDLPMDVPLNQPFSINLLLDSTTPAGNLTVSVSTEGSLELIDQAQFEFDLSSPDKSMALMLLLREPGAGFLNLAFMETDPSGTALQGRSISIPIHQKEKAAERTQRPNNKIIISNTNEGKTEKIIEMPAERR